MSEFSYREKGTMGFFKTFELYPVPNEWIHELYNYFINGYEPGGFHIALFANDLSAAVLRSHPINNWTTIQQFVKWNIYNAPARSIGSYENVNQWLALTNEDRRAICLARGWLLTEKEISWKTVSGERV